MEISEFERLINSEGVRQFCNEWKRSLSGNGYDTITSNVLLGMCRVASGVGMEELWYECFMLMQVLHLELADIRKQEAA